MGICNSSNEFFLEKIHVKSDGGERDWRPLECATQSLKNLIPRSLQLIRTDLRHSVQFTVPGVQLAAIKTKLTACVRLTGCYGTLFRMTRCQNFSRLTKTIPFSIAYRFFTFDSVPSSSSFCKYFTSTWGERKMWKCFGRGERLGGKKRERNVAESGISTTCRRHVSCGRKFWMKFELKWETQPCFEWENFEAFQFSRFPRRSGVTRPENRRMITTERLALTAPSEHQISDFLTDFFLPQRFTSRTSNSGSES